MRRRGQTVLVGAIVVILLTIATTWVKVPYVEIVPGPTYNTLGADDTGKSVIEITGVPETQSAGQLRFLTVRLLPELTLLQALIAWLNSDTAVAPREIYFPPDQTQQQIEDQNAKDFAESQSAAETAAMVKLGYPMKITIKEIKAGLPAQGRLKVGDVIKTVDGSPMETTLELHEKLQSKPVGAVFAFGIVRDGKPMVVEVPTAEGQDKAPRIGITQEATPTAPFQVKIPIENIGGPSAGLMLALGIIDKVEAEDLTGGKIIAGTGTIDDEGRVGPIGGVAQKIVAAKQAGATFFLTPTDNCADAVANQRPGVVLIEVATLDDALAALADIRSGKAPTLCPGANR